MLDHVRIDLFEHGVQLVHISFIDPAAYLCRPLHVPPVVRALSLQIRQRILHELAVLVLPNALAPALHCRAVLFRSNVERLHRLYECRRPCLEVPRIRAARLIERPLDHLLETIPHLRVLPGECVDVPHHVLQAPAAVCMQPSREKLRDLLSARDLPSVLVPLLRASHNLPRPLQCRPCLPLRKRAADGFTNFFRIFKLGVAFFCPVAYSDSRKSSILGSARKGRAQIDGALSISDVPNSVSHLLPFDPLWNG